MSTDDELKQLREQIGAISAAILAKKPPTILFGDYAQKYLEAKLLRPTLRQSTKNHFTTIVVLHLIPAFGRLPLDKINNTIWLTWVQETKAAGKLTKFFNPRKYLVEILLAAKKEGVLDRSHPLDNPDEYRAVGRVLEDAEVFAILRKAARPFRLIFFVFWQIGCRPREILKWRWDNIHFGDPIEKTRVFVPGDDTKNGFDRYIAIGPRVARILRRRVARKIGPYVFPKHNDPDKPRDSYDAAWKTALRRARVKRATVYDFRRTWITKKAAEGKSLAFMARHLQTSEPMIRRIYLKDDDEAMEGLFK